MTTLESLRCKLPHKRHRYNLKLICKNCGAFAPDIAEGLKLFHRAQRKQNRATVELPENFGQLEESKQVSEFGKRFEALKQNVTPHRIPNPSRVRNTVQAMVRNEYECSTHGHFVERDMHAWKLPVKFHLFDCGIKRNCDARPECAQLIRGKLWCTL